SSRAGDRIAATPPAGTSQRTNTTRTARHLDRRLHKRRQIDTVELADEERRACRAANVRNPRSDLAKTSPATRTGSDHQRHGRIYWRAAPGSTLRVSSNARRNQRQPIADSRSRHFESPLGATGPVSKKNSRRTETRRDSLDTGTEQS